MNRIFIRVLPALLILLTSATSASAGDLEKRLLDAIKNGDIATTRELISQGANVNALDDPYKTPLSLAADAGRLQIVALLIQKGADVNGIPSSRTTSPLYAAASGEPYRQAWYAAPEIVRLLIKSGANVNGLVGLEHYDTPLCAALTMGNNKVATILIVNGANVNSIDNIDRSTPLFFLLSVDESPGSGDVIRLLIQKGVDPNAKNSDGETPLVIAIRHSSIENIKALLENGADINAMVHGFTPLMYAVGTGNKPGRVAVTKLLLEKGADLNIKAQDTEAGIISATHNTALEWASKGCEDNPETCKNSEIVNLLVQAKMGISIPEATPPR